MWVSKKKWAALEKKVAGLEGQVQSQHDQIAALSDTYTRPPMDAISPDSSLGRYSPANNVGGGGIQYPCMAIQTLRNDATCTTSNTYNQPGRSDNMADKIDARKAYEAIAAIIADRENVEIKLVGLKKKEETEEKDTA